MTSSSSPLMKSMMPTLLCSSPLPTGRTPVRLFALHPPRDGVEAGPDQAIRRRRPHPEIVALEAGEGMFHVPPGPRELQGKRRIHRPMGSILGVLQLRDQLARL